MNKPRILIIDDQKNIRMTLKMALESPDWDVASASDGEEGLALLQTGKFGLALLDLNMPGMHGMDVLRRIRVTHPQISIIIITAHGTIEYSVEAMKLGAVDFIPKPFTPAQIRTLVAQVFQRPAKAEQPPAQDPNPDYVDLAKFSIQRGAFDQALQNLEKATSQNPGNPVTLNMLGGVWEIRGNVLEAQKYYRAALSLDPTYSPARQNLERLVMNQTKGDITFGKERRS